jgi:spore germination protein YaaH
VSGEWSFRYDLPLTNGATSCTQHREVHYVDSAGALQRAALARTAGFHGASLWALGYEDEAFWTALAAPPTTDNP